MNEVEVDELTGLWALSYKLSNKKYLDKKDTINLINKINDNLKILFAEPLDDINDEIEQDQKNDLLPKYFDDSKAPQIKNIDQITVEPLLEILKEKNPLFKIKESLLPSTVKELIPPTESQILLAENQPHTMRPSFFVNTHEKENMNNKPQFIRAPHWATQRSRTLLPMTQRNRGASGIKKSRRKKRKRTKRKRTKRKRSKHKRSKRKRTKRKRKRTKHKRSKKTGGALMAAAAALAKEKAAAAALAAEEKNAAAAEHAAEERSPPPPYDTLSHHAVEEQQPQHQPRQCGANGDPSESILSKDYQLRLNLREGGYYDRRISDWLVNNGVIYDTAIKISRHLNSTYDVITLSDFSKIDEEELFKYIESFGVKDQKLISFKIAFKMLKLHSEGARCRYNTGSIVRNLVCDEEDIFCLIGCPGPNFKVSTPINGAMVLNKYGSEIIPQIKDSLQGRYEQKSNQISVIILEDKDYYKNTTELGLYDTIQNQILIPCIDMQAHNSEQYKEFIKLINQRRKEDHMIITHCFCGAGRTSSMIMCCKLYFLIYNILKPTLTALTPYTLLNIPELFGITPDSSTENNKLQVEIKMSPAGQWLIDNYRSYSSRARKQPGHEFLKIERTIRHDGRTSYRSEKLFFDRLNAISRALAEIFEIPFYKAVNSTKNKPNISVRGTIIKGPRHTSDDVVDNVRKNGTLLQQLPIIF